MTDKLVTRMVEYASDANPDKKWSSTFVGVLPKGSNPEPTIDAVRSAMLTQYEFMCAAVDDAIHARYLAAVLEDIQQIELGQMNEIEEETEGWLFWMNRNGVHFEGKFDQGTGGQVSLAQFKLAVQTYLRFLQDPERKPIEVVFPD